MDNRYEKRRPRSPDFNFDIDKVAPQALDLEEAVLGGILLEEGNDRIRAIIGKIRPKMFYKDAHKLVMEAILELKEKESPVDMLLVTEQLRFTGKLDLVGGPMFITNLTSKIVSTANIEWHFRIIYQKFVQREIIRICSQSVKEGYDDITDCFMLLDDISTQLDHLDPKLAEVKSVTAKALAEDMTKELQSIQIDTHTNIIIPNMTYSLGWPRFDEVVTVGRDKIIIIAGASGSGKSKYIHQIMSILLERYSDISVMWISLEDSRQDILRSYIASKTLVTAKHIKMRKFDKSLLEPMLHYTEVFKRFDIEFIDEAIASKDIIYDFTQFCEKRKDRFNILVVDNMKSLDDKEAYKHDQSGLDDYILHNMLKCRQKTKACLFLLHHFNDAQQDKDNLKYGYRPVIKDMKGSEGFRRVANQVLLINSFNIYKDLMSSYSGIDKEILKRLFIVDTGKNREDKISDESGLIHFVQDLGFSRFHEIPIPTITNTPKPPPPMTYKEGIPF